MAWQVGAVQFPRPTRPGLGVVQPLQVELHDAGQRVGGGVGHQEQRLLGVGLRRRQIAQLVVIPCSPVTCVTEQERAQLDHPRGGGHRFGVAAQIGETHDPSQQGRPGLGRDGEQLVVRRERRLELTESLPCARQGQQHRGRVRKPACGPREELSGTPHVSDVARWRRPRYHAASYQRGPDSTSAAADSSGPSVHVTSRQVRSGVSGCAFAMATPSKASRICRSSQAAESAT
jgi:hypothetical protein